MFGRTGVLAAGLALWSSAALADPLDALALKTGDDLYSACSHQHERDAMAASLEMACLGYIAGVVDGYSMMFCTAPQTSTRGQARDIVVSYLRDHPVDRHKLAIHEAWLALSAAWPCKK